MTIRKRHLPGSLALAAFLGCSTGAALVVDDASPRHAVAQDVDDGYFYTSLAPHGQWFFQADFGWTWHPAGVSAGWRPYTEGQWVWADDVGWTWATNEPWGWATYHYGRWYFDPYYGWSWVPGRTWAPAWVSWRVESGFIGWAPMWPVYFDLHPEYRWDSWHHDNDWDRRHQGRDWDRWVFTRDRDFTSERVGRVAIRDRRERDTLFSRSRDVTQYDESHPERIGHSIDRTMVEKAVGRPVRSVRIETADKPEARDDTRQQSIRMFRPGVKEARDKTPDRLGLAKEPSREARETDTIRQEKTRLDSVHEKNKGRDKGAAEPAVREPEAGRGGAAAPEPAERVQPKPHAQQPSPRHEAAPQPQPKPHAQQPKEQPQPRPHAQQPQQQPQHERQAPPMNSPQGRSHEPSPSQAPSQSPPHVEHHGGPPPSGGPGAPHPSEGGAPAAPQGKKNPNADEPGQAPPGHGQH